MENLSTDIHKSFGRSLFNKRMSSARYLTEHYSCVLPTIKRYSLQSRFCHSTGKDSLNAALSLPVLQKHDCRKDCKLKSKMKRKKKQLILSDEDLTLSLSSRSVSNRLLSFLRSRNCLRTRKSVKIAKARFREASIQKRVFVRNNSNENQFALHKNTQFINTSKEKDV